MRMAFSQRNPWSELEQIGREFERLFQGHWPSRMERNRARFGAVNVFKGDSGVLVNAVLPGLAPEDIDISIKDQMLTLKVDRTEDQEAEGRLSRQERHTTEFSKQVHLPVEVDASSCEATYDKGVLTVKLALPVEQQPQKIEVRAV